MNKKWIITGLTVATLTLTGCGALNDNAGKDNNGKQLTQNTRYNNNLNRPMDVKYDLRNNDLRSADRTLTKSNRVEREVEKLKEVDDAHVIISNNNAYVAVRLAGRNNQGINDNNLTNNGYTNVNYNNNGNVNRNRALDGDGNGFLENGRVNRDNNNNANDGIIDGIDDAGNKNTKARDNRNDDGFNLGVRNDNNNYGLNVGSDNSGNNTGINVGTRNNGNNNGINVNNKNNGKNRGLNVGNKSRNNKGVNVGNQNDNNNGLNVGTNNGTNGSYIIDIDNNTNRKNNNYSLVSNRFEQKVADQVRKADDKIHRVYVSVNPDFYNQMNTMTNDIRTNRINNTNDHNGLFDRFDNMINNYFGNGNNYRYNTR